MAFEKIPDTGSASVCGTRYWAIYKLSGITIIFIPDKEPKYRTVLLNTGHLLATLSVGLNKTWAIYIEGSPNSEVYE